MLWLKTELDKQAETQHFKPQSSENPWPFDCMWIIKNGKLRHVGGGVQLTLPA